MDGESRVSSIRFGKRWVSEWIFAGSEKIDPTDVCLFMNLCPSAKFSQRLINYLVVVQCNLAVSHFLRYVALPPLVIIKSMPMITL